MCQTHHIEVGPHSKQVILESLQFHIEQEQEIMDLGDLATIVQAAERLIDYARCAMQLESTPS